MIPENSNQHGIKFVLKSIAKKFSKESRPVVPENAFHKVLISGPGRSGTTLMMQVLTELGFDTGFEKGNYGEISKISNAGMEQGLFVAAHRNAKSACEQGNLIVDHLYIPIRSLDDVVRSRARVTEIAQSKHPGGLVSKDADAQRVHSAEWTYNLIQAAVHYDLPFTLLDFPRFSQDPKYFFFKLEFLMKNIKYDHFLDVFNQVVNPKLIHTFE